MGAEENDDSPDSPLDGGVKWAKGYLMQGFGCISFTVPFSPLPGEGC